MQFQVPQFIEVEDKIFGPLSIRQFIYLAGGGALCYIAYTLLPLIFALPVMAAVGALSGALAFYKYNGRAFIEFVESMFKFYVGNRLYLWKKENHVTGSKPVISPVKASTVAKIAVPRLSATKLHELAQSLDINENPETEHMHGTYGGVGYNKEQHGDSK